jgi:hypothetical protein
MPGRVATMIAKRCRIGACAARRRLRLYRAGAIDMETLLHVGKRHLGGNPGGRKPESRPTGEWLALDDSARSRGEIDWRPGSWERQHIRPAEVARENGKRRRYVNTRDRDNGDGSAVYYNPARVAL